KMLFGFRALINNDLERRIIPQNVSEGMARTQEYRLGGSISPWRNAWIDAGVTRLDKRNELAEAHVVMYHPNLGFEQGLLNKHLALRFGVDEVSPAAGFTVRYDPFKVDAVYVHNLAKDRVGPVFGTESNSVLVTFTFDYGKLPPRKEPKQ